MYPVHVCIHMCVPVYVPMSRPVCILMHVQVRPYDCPRPTSLRLLGYLRYRDRVLFEVVRRYRG